MDSIFLENKFMSLFVFWLIVSGAWQTTSWIMEIILKY